MAKHAALRLSIFSWLSSQLPSVAIALSSISVKGTKLFDDDGNQFFVKGVAYSSGHDRIDPLLDTDQCQIDAGLMKSLGANTIRVYTVDGTKNHDGCMQAFRSQGIYVWLDLPNPVESINHLDAEWTMELYANWTSTVDAFAKYDNILFFNIGNEIIIDDEETTLAAPFLKAAARDIKAFRNARGYRSIPISYSASDTAEYRVLTGNYLTCGEANDAIDIYGMNIYSWCGNSSYYISGYDKLYEQFQKLNVPVLFSETGCKPEGDGNRNFDEVATMLGPVFQAIFSGVVVYEWTLEANGYGIVSYSNDVNTGFPSTLDDYNALATVFSSVNPSGTAMSAYKPSNSAAACPTSDSSAGWLVDGNAALPTISGLQLNTITALTTISREHGATERSGSGVSPPSRTSNPGGGQKHIDSSTSGLSAGPIAGIVVGCTALAFATVAAFFWIRRARALKRSGALAGAPSDGAQQGFKAELPAQSVGRLVLRQELDASHQSQPREYWGPNGFSMIQESRKEERRQSRLYEMEGSGCDSGKSSGHKSEPL